VSRNNAGDRPILAWLDIRSASLGVPGDRIEEYLVLATRSELDAFVLEVKSHDYWATAGPLNPETPTLPSRKLDDVRHELYWLFED
jgi:hypothetical protein